MRWAAMTLVLPALRETGLCGGGQRSHNGPGKRAETYDRTHRRHPRRIGGAGGVLACAVEQEASPAAGAGRPWNLTWRQAQHSGDNAHGGGGTESQDGAGSIPNNRPLDCQDPVG